MRRYAGLALVIAAIVLGGCVTASSPAPIPICGEGRTMAPDGTFHCVQDIFPTSQRSAPVSPKPDPTTVCGSADVSIDYVPYTTSTLAGYGWGFIVAEVKSFGPAVFNTSDGTRPNGVGLKPAPLDPNSNARIYTPVDVQIYHVIDGQTKPGPGRVLIEGGTVGCYTTRVYVAPRVEPGHTYVFVLTDALDARSENVLDTQEAKFAWMVNADGTVDTPDGVMTLDSLASLVAKAAPTPSP